MADPPPYPDTGVGPDRRSTTSTPRWVKVFGIIALALVLLVGFIMLTGGGGGHGPSRHTPSGGGPGGQTPPSSVTESGDVGGHTPPAGGHTP